MREIYLETLLREVLDKASYESFCWFCKTGTSMTEPTLQHKYDCVLVKIKNALKQS